MIQPIELLNSLESDYKPSASTAEKISDKNLVAFIGAFAVGKTTLIERIHQQHADFAEVISFTTRPSRGDGDHYRFTTHTPKNL